MSWSPTQRRILVGAVALLAVAVAGVVEARRPRAQIELLRSGPGHAGEWLRAVEREIAGAKTRVWACMYVMHPGDRETGTVRDFIATLAAAARRGVDVRVILDSGSRYGDNDGQKYGPAAAVLQAAGVRVVPDGDALTTHAKCLIVDDGVAVVGSHNWTHNALTTNREASLLVRDPEVVRQLADWFATTPGW
jgi:phosphatidylserine/phosphatidylglycerophosphate/cardiolipin synthase-like enzyme